MPIVSYKEVSSVSVDYIIVGGGTAGLALAARLSETPAIQVLVIEAGVRHGPTPEIDIPGYMGRTIANPKFDWTFLTVPQAYANGQVVLQPRGKGLGGSSLNNFMGMFRPSATEIDALEEDFGMSGWNWKSLLHYMKKSETLQPSDVPDDVAHQYAVKPDPTCHGTHGPVQKSYGPTNTELPALLFDAAETLGVQRNPETGNGVNDGSITVILSIDAKTATRSSAASAYLEPNVGRPNLLVLTEAQVTKVIMWNAGALRRAAGVELVYGGQTVRLDNVKRDVILAAGSFQTPQILELSGIGNPEILLKHGIETIIDLPGVGENLQDHIGVCTVAEVTTEDVTPDILTTPEVIKQHEELYKEQKGLFASIPPRAFVFIPADVLGAEEDVTGWKASAETHSAATLTHAHPALKRGLEKQYDIQRRLFADNRHPQAELLQWAGRQPMPYIPPAEPGKRYTSMFCAVTHPYSRGSVHIASSDPLAPPAIDPKYFSHPLDIDLAVGALAFAHRVLRTPPLGDRVGKSIAPAEDVIAMGKAGLEGYVREFCGPVYHPVGTAAMMRWEDGGVVDAELKVYGTSNLRVVDASVLPLQLSCHIQSVVYAIAEKAADILKSEAMQDKQ